MPPSIQRTPTSILREQASILSQLTKGVLIGSIEQEPTANNILIYILPSRLPPSTIINLRFSPCKRIITIYPLTLTDHTTHVQRQCLNKRASHPPSKASCPPRRSNGSSPPVDSKPGQQEV